MAELFSGPTRLIWLAAGGLVALVAAWGAGGAFGGNGDRGSEGSLTPAPVLVAAEVPRAAPAIDAAAPEVTETATFALG